jgi:hypothetical protein
MSEVERRTARVMNQPRSDALLPSPTSRPSAPADRRGRARRLARRPRAHGVTNPKPLTRRSRRELTPIEPSRPSRGGGGVHVRCQSWSRRRRPSASCPCCVPVLQTLAVRQRNGRVHGTDRGATDRRWSLCGHSASRCPRS